MRWDKRKDALHLKPSLHWPEKAGLGKVRPPSCSATPVLPCWTQLASRALSCLSETHSAPLSETIQLLLPQPAHLTLGSLVDHRDSSS